MIQPTQQSRGVVVYPFLLLFNLKEFTLRYLDDDGARFPPPTDNQLGGGDSLQLPFILIVIQLAHKAIIVQTT